MSQPEPKRVLKNGSEVFSSGVKGVLEILGHVFSVDKVFCMIRFIIYNTVKLARAKLPANAGNFTCSSQVKRVPRAVYLLYMQFTCNYR